MLALVAFGSAGATSADTRSGAEASGAQALSAREVRWVQAAMPVVAYARRQALPLDIVVQPQPTSGHSPVAMAHRDSRCSLVFSLGGNPLADDTAARIADPLFVPIVEAIVAHEVAHCWRYLSGAWRSVPAGFSDHTPAAAADDPDLHHRWQQMRVTRREEGFADLVGLAWTRQQHPAAYAAVHRWFTQERADQPVPGSHHDTRVWLRLAALEAAFASAPTPFEQALPLWTAGLALGD